MRFSPSLRTSVTRRGDKERRLGAFLGRHLGGPYHAPRAILIIARSAESPVVKAVAAIAGEIAAGGHSVRMIVAQPDRDALSNWAPAVAGAECELRWARDRRLIEVHEQLVVGPSTCWTGDSMRRDPAKSDALESFIDDCGDSAGAAAAAFERLWTASAPLPWALPAAREGSLSGAGERRL